jgi:hypothetical protein
MPFDSIEVRWFGTLDRNDRNGLITLLKTLGEVDERPDDYILVPGALDFGVKVRGPERDAKGKQLSDKLEFKGRTIDLGSRCFTEHVTGRVEAWTKWSYEGEGALALMGQSSIVRVEKSRFQRKYGYDNNFNLVLVDPKAKVPKGGAFEVTLLAIETNDYWTVGVEAFPLDAETIGRFGEYVSELITFLEDKSRYIPRDVLDYKSSLSYPAWLARRP